MPRTRSSAAATKPGETNKLVEFEDHVNTDGENDNDEAVEEEVEYEEVEEEVEVEEDEEVEVEEEEVEEVDEDEEEEEVEEEEEETEEHDVSGGGEQNVINDENMKDAEIEEEVKKKHNQLLALPPHGSEVYLGGFTQDVSEDDLRSFCGSIGEVTEVNHFRPSCVQCLFDFLSCRGFACQLQIRIMKGKGSNENKGYAFVTFRTKEMASEAIKSLNNTELKGRRLKCSTSQEKHRLFIGNVPRSWGEEDMKKVVTKVGPGVITVELLKDPQNSSRNRGFAFIEYYNHACAEYSREKMSDSSFKLDENAPTVSWADPKNVESSASSLVKAVYVKNLPKNVTQDQLRKSFEHHGKITKVVLPPAKPGHENSRFGFVHFAERSSAMKALKNTEKYEIDGQVLECSLAKPQADQKSSGQPNSQKGAVLPSYPSPLGYGLVGANYGAVSGGLTQPLVYGRGAAPPGLAMIPMLLPDGRIGYVLQQPQPQTPQPSQRGGRSGTTAGSSGGRRGGDRGRGRSRYNPY
ncbi:heterogeneous nuclear ribonucleoprotein Q-like isoform X1 [Coffea eugenioides]|uniref:heterogeneous nuclear ribonucleoprotein Q-like isoform X1 n=1 Tax=Coffea eugenioides TaxID=49369 RepID=UPI000F5CDD04|nr:heterogeneous nuclear ribonucleoprotein Q-like isoform X1 [Coffea arabica]XP_027071251.1 heterogeneous nuclear ribonucleoprotein Q-like isoform X1 [Coffea arabica]XP_027071252.1 heterogeneous nuclear ribonucleoprotein Q-like isoform X1 [Coffea arabica]XP_027176603.1 heterogeneous nuclear ribonucleoprotein Q-like isoform X1 [Coffea eugenioides]XP_027176604.1 heterogeneous nuclear ribonucleoprotein Q-like isoform X1 [Coffea eugenioides]XP_027176605.1 heterogeneous nuclear ribonucleoprotein Q-